MKKKKTIKKKLQKHLPEKMCSSREQHNISGTVKEFTPTSGYFTISTVFTDIGGIDL